MVSTAVKAALNVRLHDEVMGLAGDPTDYTASKTAMQPALDNLAVDGWDIAGWLDQIAGAQAVSWELANFIRLHRVMILMKTRTAEHQALVEALPISQGGVPPGDDGTYEGGLQQVLTFELGDQAILDEVLVVIDEQPTIAAILCLAAKPKGPRPANWLRDV